MSKSLTCILDRFLGRQSERKLDLIIGCCLADLVHPSGLCQRLLEIAGDGGAVAYLPITFPGNRGATAFQWPHSQGQGQGQGLSRSTFDHSGSGSGSDSNSDAGDFHGDRIDSSSGSRSDSSGDSYVARKAFQPLTQAEVTQQGEEITQQGARATGPSSGPDMPWLRMPSDQEVTD